MECEKALQDLWLIDQPNGPHFSGQINYLMLSVHVARYSFFNSLCYNNMTFFVHFLVR